MSGYGKQIALTASVAIVIAVGLGLGVYYIQPQLSGTSSSSSSTLTDTISSSASSFLSTTTDSFSTIAESSNSTSIPLSTIGSCSSAYQGGGKFQVNENSTLDLCVKFYYYSSGNATIVTPLDQLTIQSFNGTLVKSAMSNFTVTTSLANFSIGGSSNTNEGIMETFQIHANAVSNGTYILNLGWLLPQEQECTFEFSLIVGNGTPNYTENFIGHCVTSSGSSNTPYPANILYAQVTAYTG